MSRASPASPSQVDKRMVTQMLAAYLEQSNHPKAQHEILTKMAETRRHRKNAGVSLPIGSMYAIYGNIYHQYTMYVSIYTIHGSYGL